MEPLRDRTNLNCFRTVPETTASHKDARQHQGVLVCASGAHPDATSRRQAAQQQGSGAAVSQHPPALHAGFHGSAKLQLQAQVAGLGAAYSGDLESGRTTHLVCRRLIDAFGSAKYRMALKW